MIDIQLITDSMPQLLHGALATIQIALCSSLLGFSLGTLLGLAQWKGSSILRVISSFYISIIRGTPMLIQIFFAYYILPQIGINVPAFWTAIIAIGLNSSAYIAHVIRSGLSSVPIGQIEAARTLGFSSLQITQYIVLPQAIRVVIPALGNELITLVKDSSLASIIGVTELSREASYIRSLTYDAISVYVAVAGIYLFITLSLSILLDYIEKRLQYA